MIDPSTADVTARVVECLGRFGWPAEHPAIQRAVKFLLKDQSDDGSWFGALGRQLRLRNQWCPARLGNRFADRA